MDFRPPHRGKPGGIRFLFDCGTIDQHSLAAIVLQPDEISEYRLVALPLLRGPIRRRVRAACRGRGLVYLEDGRPVPAAGPQAQDGASSPPSQHETMKQHRGQPHFEPMP